MEKVLKCPRCGNEDQRFFGELNGKKYCRLCVTMNGETAKKQKVKIGPTILKLNYSLSKEQKQISDKLLENFKNNKDSLVNAVCGAGKTELVYHLIAHCCAQGKSVAFAVPRKDVVIELFYRIKDAFPNRKVISLYGGHTNDLYGDIVVLTTHQLFRYEKYFNLIILDEIDAFPFKDNPLLYQMFERARSGPIVMMSATPSDEVIQFFSENNREILELNTRFHRNPLPVPKIVIKIGYFKLIWLVKKLKEFQHQKKVVFVFAPTIEKCEFVYKILSIFIKGGNFVHSKQKLRQKIIADFKEGKYFYLVSTAVLERGVTFKDLQVIIYDADHKIYDVSSLIQISGRVGRKMDAPKGEVFFLVNKETNDTRKAITTIEDKNKHLQDMF